MSIKETTELLKKLCSINSVFPNEHNLSEFIQSYLLEQGFTVETVLTDSTRPNIIGTFMNAPHYVGFYGHMDTVPPASDYQRDPFTVVIDGDIARGLGTCDMKGGLSVMLRLAARAKEINKPFKLIFGVDEEEISKGAHDLCSSGLLDSLSHLIVAESGQVQDFSQPISVCLGRKGRIVFEIHVTGKSAHAAEAHKGINAIEDAARLVHGLKTLSLGEHEKLGSSTIVVQQIHSKADSFSVPDQCTLTCSLLSTPGVTSEIFIQKVHELSKELNVSASIQTQKRETPYGEAYEVPLNEPFVSKILNSITKPIGAEPIYTPSVADENVFARRLNIPVITIGAIGAGDHTKDEWVKLSSLETLLSVYENILTK